MRFGTISWMLMGLVLCSEGGFAPVSLAAPFRVLAVMSYEADNPWCGEIRQGIASVLGKTSDITYVYMNTKVNLTGGPQQAGLAWEAFQRIRPHGVIAADDNAQSMFVLPYLKGKTRVPVMCCGVNEAPETYGYPGDNVSGTLERGHIRESIAFARQLLPGMTRVGFLARKSPSGEALVRQVAAESGTYAAETASFELVQTQAELVAAGKKLAGVCDVIYLDSLVGITDTAGLPMDLRRIVRVLKTCADKPLIGANRYHVIQGALCAVVKTGQEQGETAGEMLLKAMEGTPVADIPLTRNFKGRRVINVTVMREFNIRPRPIVLLGADLVKDSL